MSEIIYKIDNPTNFSTEEKKEFVKLLEKQKKVQNPSVLKLDRCKWLCTCKINDQMVSIGAMKPATKSDFDKTHADLELQSNFEYEIGYCYTDDGFKGRRLSSTIVSMLIEKEPQTNLIASTELKTDNPMIRILEKYGFKQSGKSWKSVIHSGDLGLFLRMHK